MLVQRVVMADPRVESWTVLGADDVPVEPVERYLAYLTGIERSPNTVKAYAHDLRQPALSCCKPSVPAGAAPHTGPGSSQLRCRTSSLGLYADAPPHGDGDS